MASKTANVLARVEPSVKEQAESIMTQLGIPAWVSVRMTSCSSWNSGYLCLFLAVQNFYLWFPSEALWFCIYFLKNSSRFSFGVSGNLLLSTLWFLYYFLILTIFIGCDILLSQPMKGGRFIVKSLLKLLISKTKNVILSLLQNKPIQYLLVAILAICVILIQILFENFFAPDINDPISKLVSRCGIVALSVITSMAIENIPVFINSIITRGHGRVKPITSVISLNNMKFSIGRCSRCKKFKITNKNPNSYNQHTSYTGYQPEYKTFSIFNSMKSTPETLTPQRYKI